jgi:hypothetical protein
VLSPAYLEDVLETVRAQYGDTSDIERQIRLADRKVDDLKIAINRVFDSIERTGSDRAYDRLKQRETELAQAEAEAEQLKSQLAAAKIEITPEAMTIVLNEWRNKLIEARETNEIKLIRTWLYRFVSKIELGYNFAKIHYTYPMVDFSTSARVAFPLRGGTSQRHALRMFFCLTTLLFHFARSDQRPPRHHCRYPMFLAALRQKFRPLQSAHLRSYPVHDDLDAP